MKVSGLIEVRILLVDDASDTLDLYREILSMGMTLDQRELLDNSLGALISSEISSNPANISYELTFCSQAEEAVESVRNSLQIDKPFSLAFIDVLLPPGPNGVWAAEQIRILDPNIQIVMVTGKSDLDMLELAHRVPPTDKLLYLQKPFYPAEIQQSALALCTKWYQERQLQDSQLNTQILLGISQCLHRHIDLDDLIQNIVEEIKLHLDTDNVAIILHDEKEDCFIFRWVESEIAEKLVEFRFPVDQGIAGSVFKSGKAELIHDISKDNRHFKEIDKTHGFETQSMIAVPLLTKDRKIGVLEVLNKRSGEFSQKDFIFLLALAPMVSMALDNAKMYNELKNANEHLEGLTRKLQHDIKERLKVEEELVKAKELAEAANHAKSRFLANMSHELRTPMHGILSYSRFGMQKIAKVTREKLGSYFEQIDASGQRLMALLDDLLDLAKLESGKGTYSMIENDLKSVVETVSSEFSLLIRERGQTLEVVQPEISTEAVFDRDKIRQVMRNILSNARKFSPDGAKITIQIREKAIEVGTDGSDGGLEVLISDQGVGIPEDELEAVFDKFVQSSKTRTGAGGTGLGLAICKEIIAAHDGEIWAENNPTGGVTFHFAIPRLPKRRKRLGEILLEDRLISESQLVEALKKQRQ